MSWLNVKGSSTDVFSGAGVVKLKSLSFKKSSASASRRSATLAA